MQRRRTNGLPSIKLRSRPLIGTLISQHSKDRTSIESSREENSAQVYFSRAPKPNFRNIDSARITAKRYVSTELKGAGATETEA